MRRALLWLVPLAILASAFVLAGYAWRTSRHSGVLLTWSTATELDNAGFNLYRSESPQGPFVRINPSLISPAADPLSGDQYSYTDTQVIPGRKYYYQLESIDRNGTAGHHGQIEIRAAYTGWAEGLGALALAGLSLLAWDGIRRNEQRGQLIRLAQEGLGE